MPKAAERRSDISAEMPAGGDSGLPVEGAGKRSAGNLQMLSGGGYANVAEKFP